AVVAGDRRQAHRLVGTDRGLADAVRAHGGDAAGDLGRERRHVEGRVAVLIGPELVGGLAAVVGVHDVEGEYLPDAALNDREAVDAHVAVGLALLEQDVVLGLAQRLDRALRARGRAGSGVLDLGDLGILGHLVAGQLGRVLEADRDPPDVAVAGLHRVVGAGVGVGDELGAVARVGDAGVVERLHPGGQAEAPEARPHLVAREREAGPAAGRVVDLRVIGVGPGAAALGVVVGVG